MVKLVTRISFVKFILFHVEHYPRSTWFWRWRITSAAPPAYCEWREGKSKDPRVVIQPEIGGCMVEAQWRSAEDQPWSQVALHEAATGTASFVVKALEDFSSLQPFRAYSAVPGDEMVACYEFAPLTLAAGVETVIRGVADGPHVANVLLREGDFDPVSDLISITNRGPSEGSLVPVRGAARLSMVPGMEERRIFAVGSRKLVPESALLETLTPPATTDA